MELRRVAVELFEREIAACFRPAGAVASIALPSCGGGGSGTKEVCTPGETQACICTNGSTGAQSCAADGSQFVRALAPLRERGAQLPREARADGGSAGGTGGTCARRAKLKHASAPTAALERSRAPQRHQFGACTCSPACPTALCGAACCGTDEVCIVKAGVTRCAQSCTTSSDCTVAMPCCSLLAPATGGSPPAKGACTSDTSACRCTTGASVSSVLVRQLSLRTGRHR